VSRSFWIHPFDGELIPSGKRLLDHVGHARKSGRVMDGHVRKDLSVQVDSRLLQPAHKHTVGEAVLARGGIDADDPQLTKVPFPQFPIPVGKGFCPVQGDESRLEELAVPPAETFSSLQHFVSPVSGIDSSFYPRHGSTSLSRKFFSNKPALTSSDILRQGLSFDNGILKTLSLVHTFYRYGMSLLMLFLFAELTTPDFLMLRFLLVVFFVRMWLPKALLLMIFPDPVFLKRFAAPRFVLIFGMSYLPIKHTHISSPASMESRGSILTFSVGEKRVAFCLNSRCTA
jgi:hypothetical protein